MSGECLEKVWRMSGECLEKVWGMSGEGLENIWRMSGKGLEKVWGMSGGCLEKVWRRANSFLEVDTSVLEYHTIAIPNGLYLLPQTQQLCSTQRPLRRQRRDWIIPANKLKENYDYTSRSYIAKIRSDLDKREKLHYTLLGHGANLEPINLFVVGEATGLVRVLKILDREEMETYFLTGVARFRNGTVAEGEINLRLDVEDENDNPPVFLPLRQRPGPVRESSRQGTVVANMTATDADKPSTLHSKIAYSIVKQEPSESSNLFAIDRNTGLIYVKEPTLDRERVSSYRLTVQAQDMDGAPEGNTGTTTVSVKVTDINDHIPTLEKDQYSGSIVENTANVEVMRFKTLDADEENSHNWLAMFEIISGNENGIFSIKTDPKTNEGILMLEKPVDFEENPDIKLGVVVFNVAPAAEVGVEGGGGGGGGGDGGGDGGGGADGGGGGGGNGGGEGGGETAGGAAGGGVAGAGAETAAGTSAKLRPGAGMEFGVGVGTGSSRRKGQKKLKSYPVNIEVKNEREGPAFYPKTKPVSVSENPDHPLSQVIAVYQATDADSGSPAENVLYAKGYDPDNWLSVDPETAEIRLHKVPDRESPFLVNGTYRAHILCLTHDVPSKTATGTIALQVGDVNDNCPELTSTVDYICTDTEVVNITAQDKDGDPNGAPFRFSLVPEGSGRDWEVKPLSDTSASLRPLRPLWPGNVLLSFTIWDQQGVACPEPQLLTLLLCTCGQGEACSPEATDRSAALKERSSTFGMLGIGLLVLGMLILLCLLLMTCSFGGGPAMFMELPFDTREHMIPYHTEGQGEDRDVPLLACAPAQMAHDGVSATHANNVASNMNVSLMAVNRPAIYSTRAESKDRVDSSGFGGFFHGQMSQRESYTTAAQQRSVYSQHIALPDVYLQEFYDQSTRRGSEHLESRDSLLVYEYEGQGSPVGSVGCCSLLESENDLQFLSDLGPKFKTLADVCLPEPVASPGSETSVIQCHGSQVKQTAQPILESKQSTISNGSCSDNENVNTIQSSTMSRSCFNQISNSNITTSQTFNSTSSTGHADLVSPASTANLAMLHPPGQTLILQQQPMYYTTTPVLQPMPCIVQLQLEDSALLAERPVSTNLQGMIIVNESLGYTQCITQERHSNGVITFPAPVIDEGEMVTFTNKSHRGGFQTKSDGPGHATLNNGVNGLLRGGGGGQSVLGVGVRLEKAHICEEALPAAQSIMLTGGGINLEQVVSEQALSGQVCQVGQHIMIERPRNLPSVSPNPDPLCSAVTSPASAGSGFIAPLPLVASSAGSVSGSLQTLRTVRKQVTET
ncbi:desmoglein-2.1-like [Lampris incognitus]|uniref:desmoglein-2.1-like n=1 Tax=Lampris incognitus TaxID=2546036 RepID=UPI0024B4AEFB|nr:desmoglein-2.1-like [Lampris incognitus]